MENNKISIIIPTYNTEKYIEKAIKSVMEQTYQNFELLIVDDCSKDNTKEICKKYVGQYENIELIEKSKNVGVSDSRNIGLSRATGKYIYFMDSDDYLEKDMLQGLIDIMNKYQPNLISTGFFSEVEGQNIVDKIFSEEKFYENKEEIKKDFIMMWEKHIYYNVWNKLYVKEIIDRYNIRFPNYNWGEDIKFNQDYLMYVNKLYNTSKCYYHYIKERNGSTTKRYQEKLFETRIRENSEFIEFFTQYGIREEDYAEFIAKRYIERTLGCIENLFHKECKLSLIEKRKKIKEIIEHEETRRYLKIFKPNSNKIAIMLITYKLHLYTLAMMMGKFLWIVKEKFPAVFNKLKNRR